jgi:DNA polymerase-1
MLKKKHWLIDGNGIFMRYFFAMDEMFNNDGVPIHGFVGFVRCLLNVLNNHEPLSMVITFDKCYNNFRKKIDCMYKSNRPKLDSSAIDQMNLSIQLFKELSIPVDFHSEFEADDLIASYIHQNPDKEFIIMSTDKDLCQLINEKVLLFNPFTKNITAHDDVVKKYGVIPEYFDLFLALQGDGSDRVKGIRGVGPKTAAKIIKHTTNLDEIPKTFQQFDFSDLNKQIQLVKLIKNIRLNNPELIKLQLNRSAGSRFLTDLGIEQLLYILNQF